MTNIRNKYLVQTRHSKKTISTDMEILIKNSTLFFTEERKNLHVFLSLIKNNIGHDAPQIKEEKDQLLLEANTLFSLPKCRHFV
jgi:hypothetical protein